ncbi:hypothetical protein [Polaribacter staleyi]|uniref:hypothetical protein n=1 Tax=Polaribacter staleyi TaxID=2022337 RepID=UPI0031BA46BA
METYLIITAICSLLGVLKFGKLIRIISLKLLFPKATIKEIESFEENTSPKYFWNHKKTKNS